MREQYDNVIKLIKEQKELEACITGSIFLDYFPGEHQDVDIFCYSEESFRELLFFMNYNPIFQILDKLEAYKFKSYIKKGQSSLNKISLITVKFTYNLCVPVNIVYRKGNKNLFDVISGFDLDLVAQGFCLKTGKYHSLRESTGMDGTWNKWSKQFYDPSIWDAKRLMRQFSRIIKYESRGYDLSSVTDKYIEIVEQMLELENIYKTERGTEFYNKIKKEFTLVLNILQEYKKNRKISDEELLILKTII